MLSLSLRRVVSIILPAAILLWFAYQNYSSYVLVPSSDRVAEVMTPEVATTPVFNTNTGKQKPLVLQELPSSVQNLFEQTWALEDPPDEILTNLKSQCDRTEWKEDYYMHCGGLTAGLTSIMSSLRVCLRMALDGGVGLAIPVMALRDSKDLRDFRTFDAASQIPYGDWFDEEHFIKQLSRSCPQLKIARLGADKKPALPDFLFLGLNLDRAEGFKLFESWAWPGKTWSDFLWGDKGIQVELDKAAEDAATSGSPVAADARLISVWTPFLFFKITEDITGHDRKVWHEFDHLIRFKPGARSIVHELLANIGDKPYIGVHYRGEKDNIWSSPEVQLERNLRIADEAWTLYLKTQNMQLGSKKSPEKLIYLACGDQDAIKDFQTAAAKKGWKVTDKWSIAAEVDKHNLGGVDSKSAGSLVSQIDALPFDHQGSLDLAMITVSSFFIGFTGSAFSYTVANHRDPLGRYRGSSVSRQWDEGALSARSHLFNDGESGHYPCCF